MSRWIMNTALKHGRIKADSPFPVLVHPRRAKFKDEEHHDRYAHECDYRSSVLVELTHSHANYDVKL